VAVHDVAALSTEMAIPFWEFHQLNGLRQTGRHGRPYPTPKWNHRCLDGKYFNAMPLYLDDARFAAMVAWFAAEGMAEDLAGDRYATEALRAPLMPHIVEVIGRFCAAHTSAELFTQAQRRRLPWGPVNAPEELCADPHLAEDRGAFTEIEHAEHGVSFVYPGRPYLLHGTPWAARRAPLLGEHTEQILGEASPASGQSSAQSGGQSGGQPGGSR
jgi:crotonobetainyl-CoA:carnitine CoA-transferase CaiB-like acyl-CoA transferase